MKKLKQQLKDFFNLKDWLKLLRSIPALALTFCVLSAVLMNILANKSIIDATIIPGWVYVVQDAGILFSWCGFLAGDLIVRAYGTKNAIRVTITTVLISLFISCILLGAATVPGIWGESFAFMGQSGALDSTGQAVNNALNNTLGNVWYVVIGSAAATLIGLIFNNIMQGALLKRIIKKHGEHYWGFVIASATSTAVGQFIDNVAFALLVSIWFFGWDWAHVISCSILGMLIELVVELIFTPITYKISKNWKKNHIGSDWLNNDSVKGVA